MTAFPAAAQGSRFRTLLCSLSGQPMAELDVMTGSSASKRHSDTGEARIIAKRNTGSARVVSWMTEIQVWARDGGGLQWAGPVTKANQDTNIVNIEAAGQSAWWDRTFVRSHDFSDAAAVDLVDAFERLHGDVLDQNPLLRFKIKTAQTGRITRMQTDGDDWLYVADVVRDLVAAGMAWTEIGRGIVAGPEIPSTFRDPITDADWVSPPHVEERGDDAASIVVVRGKNHQMGFAQCGGCGSELSRPPHRIVHLARKFDYLKIEDPGMLQNMAEEFLAVYHNPIFLVPSGPLSNRSMINPRRLVPGATVPLETTRGGQPFRARMRIESVDLNLFDGTVTPVLQPVGPFDLLAPDAS